jgi:small GTP-binding protein
MSAINYRFILIGNSGVGKTSFFRKLSTGEFYEKNISTIGIEKKTFELEIDKNNEGKSEKKNFSISLFDTAGQEKFRAITYNYFKGADGILLLYDITDKQTFESVEQWIESIRQAIENNGETRYAIILIGNKLDLVEEEVKERAVTEDEARDMCKKFDMIWGGERSIKSIDFEKLTKLFEEYVLDIYKNVGEKKNAKQASKKLTNTKEKKGPGACARCLAN